MSDTTLPPIAKVIARAWADPAYQQLLKTDPATALSQEGVAIPTGRTIQVHMEDEATCHLVLPAKPAGLGPQGPGPQNLVCFDSKGTSLLVCFYHDRAQTATELSTQIQQAGKDLICWPSPDLVCWHSSKTPSKTADLVCFNPSNLVCFGPKE
jgi:Nitrile hydratase, alpha chain